MISALIAFLSAQYQIGNTEGMLMMAQSLLSAIPDDLVALQFVGLAYLHFGQRHKAVSFFHRASRLFETKLTPASTCCEQASQISYREATVPGVGLDKAWDEIATALQSAGFDQLAQQASVAADRSRLLVDKAAD